MNISNITIAYDAEADEDIKMCTGMVTLNAYSISGPDRTPEQPTVYVKEGKDVIFEDVTGGTKASTSFDDDNGASIVSNHNLVIMLNNANNDTASGIIVASSESNESTYVTSSENSEQTLDINITEEDGKKYMEYSIGSNSYKAEILSNNVTIYVKSSARVDSEDKNGVKANINNSTDLNVYIKVDSDDSSSPRFSVGSKTGVVKTY
jgi:co-chaperonin GroES (HSP10)